MFADWFRGDIQNPLNSVSLVLVKWIKRKGCFDFWIFLVTACVNQLMESSEKLDKSVLIYLNNI